MLKNTLSIVCSLYKFLEMFHNNCLSLYSFYKEIKKETMKKGDKRREEI